MWGRLPHRPREGQGRVQQPNVLYRYSFPELCLGAGGMGSHAEGATPEDGQYSPLFPRARSPPVATGAPGKELPISRAVAHCSSALDKVGIQGSLPPHEGRGA